MDSTENLIDQIARGAATLVGVNEITKRLGISRVTLEKWRRNDKDSINALTKKILFPPPDVYIGRSPRWTMTTFKGWLKKHTGSIERPEAEVSDGD